MIDLAIVIVNYNTKDITMDCLRSVFRNPPSGSFKVWLVDNASSDGSTEQIEKSFPQVKLIRSSKNLGFAGGNNLALKKVYKNAKYCLLLNTDTIVYPHAFDRLADFAENKGFAIASCKLISPDKSFQPNTGSLPGLFPAFFWLSGIDDIVKKFVPLPSYHQESRKYYAKDRQVGWVSGSVMLVRSDVFAKIGFLNDEIFMYGEDVDFCWRAKKAGFKIGWTKSARIMHIGGASSDKPKFKQWSGEFKGLFYLYRKNYGVLASIILRIFTYLFVSLRALAFLLIGKPEHAKTYAQVIVNI
jgi:GT2 family glycosyltransferase